MILPADKGSTTVVMDRDDYVLEAERQLADTSVYRPLSADPTAEHNRKIAQFVQASGPLQNLSAKSIELLTPVGPRTPTLYLLPKTHKNILPPPGRPIVASYGSPTERASALVDAHLQPHVLNLPSHVKDTNHFLKSISNLQTPLPADAVLVTIDVVSLYTNIPHAHGLAAMESYLQTRPANSKPSTSFLVQLAQMILTMNNFMFDERHYLQIKGTAMGTRMAPSYANLFMGKLENDFLSSQPLQPLCWLRFIDDIFMIWPHSREALDSFLQNLNTNYPVNFTHNVSPHHVTFLDVDLFLEQGTIRTKVHIKPTNAQQYLHYNSCHPPHSMKSLPYSLAVRGKRICSDPKDLSEYCQKLTVAFRSRGYPATLVNNQIARVLNPPPPPTPSTITKANDNACIPLVTQYHPNLKALSQVLSSGFHILTSATQTQNFLTDPPKVAFKRPPNLRNILVNTQPPAPQTPITHGSYPCNSTRCKTCQMHPPSTSFTSSATGLSYPILQHNTCKSKNVIYQLRCNFCPAEYIGLTTKMLRERMNGHRFDCRVDPDEIEKVVPAHAYLHGKDFNSCFTIRIVKSLPPSCNPSELRRWELSHQWVTRSRFAPGLNIR